MPHAYAPGNPVSLRGGFFNISELHILRVRLFVEMCSREIGMTPRGEGSGACDS